jgi:hypothetical protein
MKISPWSAVRKAVSISSESACMPRAAMRVRIVLRVLSHTTGEKV